MSFHCPSTANNFKTPMEQWYGFQVDYNNLRIFGCVSYAHTRQGILEARAKKFIFIGYPPIVKGYKPWCIELGKQNFLISRYLIFDETNMGHPLHQNNGESTSKGDSNVSQLEVEFCGLYTQLKTSTRKDETYSDENEQKKRPRNY